MLILDRYPRRGEKIRAEIMGNHGVKVVEGRFNGKVFRVHSGAVLGTIDTGTGQVNVAWTMDKNKVVFYSYQPE